MTIPVHGALIVIDVQQAIDAPYHAAAGPCNHPQAQANIARLLAARRAQSGTVVHIRLDSTSSESAYRPGQAGNCFKPEVAPLPGEPVVGKRTNSALTGTDLEARLRAAGLETRVITGASTNNSVQATVPMAGNRGFAVYLVNDACFTFAKRDFDGRLRSAAEVHSMSLANLDGEYCRVIDTADVLG